MSVRSGFFNSLNGDRKYYTTDISSLFDGIINDGIFASVGTAFGVTADTGLNVLVGIGRAWFNSVWVHNDSVLPLTLDESELLLNRYDAIVIEIDHNEGVRAGDIKIIKGTPASSPNYPTLSNSNLVYQYPIAYIYRGAETTTLSQSDIIYVVGQTPCPFVTGILEVMPIDTIIAQWKTQWEEYLADVDYEHDDLVNDTTALMNDVYNEYTAWFNKHTNDSSDQYNNWYDSTTTEFETWLKEQKTDFDEWYANLQAALDGDVAAQHALRIIDLEERMMTLHSERAVYDTLYDSDGESITDSDGKEISIRTVFALAGGTGSGVSQNVVSAQHRIINATISTNWTGDAAPFAQCIYVPGIKSTDAPVVDIVTSPDVIVAMDELDSYSYIYRIATEDDYIYVYALFKTLVPVNIQMEVIR